MHFLFHPSSKPLPILCTAIVVVCHLFVHSTRDRACRIFRRCCHCLFKGLGIHGVPYDILQQIHHKHGATHASISKCSATIKAKNTRIGPNFTSRLRKGSVDFSFNVSLHACLDRVKGVGQITGKEASQQGCWNTSSVIVGEGVGVAFCGRKCRR